MTTGVLADLDALRALARSLVHGDPDAEDLVQDTALAALEHPPATDRPLRPWLATVLRNRWRMLHRGGSRRAAREQALASLDTTEAPSADERLERARTLERLGAALVALDEPFREVVIRRYLDGQSAAEIARALGVPAGTVRWRLKTGLERLRAELDRSAPRRQWQLALAMGVSMKAKSSVPVVVILLLAALVAGVATLVLWLRRDEPAPPPSAAPAHAPGGRAPTVPRATALAPAAAARPDPLPGQGRAIVEPIAAPYGAFAGRVINWSTGRAIAGAELTFSAGGDVVTVRSGGDGGFELTPDAAGTYALVTAEADGFLPYAPEWQHSAVRLTARPGLRVGGLTVFLFPALEYQGVVVDATGAPVKGARVRMLGSPAGEQALAGPPTRWTTDEAGRFAFQAPDDAVLEAEHARGRGRARVDGDVMITRELTIRVDGRMPPTATISGKVVDGDGQPEPGVLVRARPSSRSLPIVNDESLRAVSFATTDADGRFTLAGLDSATHDVSAEAPDRAPAVRRFVTGGTRDVVLTLDAGAPLAGQVVDGAGAAVPAFTLLVFRRDGAHRELVTARSLVEAGGRFALRLPDGEYELLAASPGWAPSAPTAATTGKPVTLRLSSGATLRGTVVATGTRAPIGHARIMREARGGGASAQPANAGTVTRDDGTFELTGIPPGPLSFTIGAGGFHPRIEAGLVAADGAVLGPITIALTPLAPGQRPTLELVGIGVKLASATDGLLVNGLVAGGGAEAAGVVAGDVLIAVDGVDVARLGLEGAIALIRGVPGTYVRVTLRRDGKPVELSIERKPLKT